MSPPPACPLCQRVARFAAAPDPFVIHEFPHSYWVIGEHQFHPGYTVLILKEHATELHALPLGLQHAFFGELMQVGAAVAAALKPWKMNYGSYGNQVPHLHWHCFPRRADDPDRLQLPWLQQAEFAQSATTPEQAATLRETLRAALELPPNAPALRF